MPATIKDVARIANCSIKTVSRVINNEPHVTPELRDRVMAAVRSVGYAPNLAARSLVQKKSYMICILMYPGFHQAASAILSRVMDITYDENYEILIQPYFPLNKRSRNKLVNLVTEHRMEGFISTPPCDADEFLTDLLSTYKVPLVQIDPMDQSNARFYVAGDNFNGSFTATEHLIHLGHKQIGFFMGPRNMRSSFERLKGYQAAMQKHGLPIHPDMIENTEFTFDGGYTALKLMLQRENTPSAIFAGSDDAAYGALYALHELGVQVPEQMSICGYDDLALSKLIWPGLTTIRQPVDEMIAMATRNLFDVLKGEMPNNPQIILSPQLVVRGTTAPPARIG